MKTQTTKKLCCGVNDSVCFIISAEKNGSLTVSRWVNREFNETLVSLYDCDNYICTCVKTGEKQFQLLAKEPDDTIYVSHYENEERYEVSFTTPAGHIITVHPYDYNSDVKCMKNADITIKNSENDVERVIAKIESSDNCVEVIAYGYPAGCEVT